MHRARVGALTFITAALVSAGVPAVADPGVSTKASGYVDNGRPAAAASATRATKPSASCSAYPRASARRQCSR